MSWEIKENNGVPKLGCLIVDGAQVLGRGGRYQVETICFRDLLCIGVVGTFNTDNFGSAMRSVIDKATPQQPACVHYTGPLVWNILATKQQRLKSC